MRTGTATRQMPATATSVLIVEDDRDVRLSLAEVLAEEGYRVAIAENGFEALCYLRTARAPGVILLDLMMPVMDGWEFLAEKRRIPSLAGIPVVVLTAGGSGKRPLEPAQVVERLKKPVPDRRPPGGRRPRVAASQAVVSCGGLALRPRCRPRSTDMTVRRRGIRVEFPAWASRAGGRRPPAGLSMSVLLVNDERAIVEPIEELLKEQGHRVVVAYDGARALELVDETVFNLVISDIRMPHVNGLSVFRRIRSIAPSTDVILMTAYGTVVDGRGRHQGEGRVLHLEALQSRGAGAGGRSHRAAPAPAGGLGQRIAGDAAQLVGTGGAAHRAVPGHLRPAPADRDRGPERSARC